MNIEHTALCAPANDFVHDTQSLRLVLDTAGRLQAASTALCRLLERSADELLGQYIWNFIAMDSLGATLDALNQVAMQPRPVTFKQCWLSRSKEHIWLQWSYLPASADGILLAQAQVIGRTQAYPQTIAA